MTIRVTQALAVESSRRGVQTALSRLFNSQRLSTTGLRVSTPSDDPAAIARLLSLKERRQDIVQYRNNAAEATTFVRTGAAQLQSISELITSAKERALQGATGATSDNSREIVAAELDTIIEDIIALANGRVGARYLFSGTAATTQPFELVTTGSGQETVVYRGNDGLVNAEISPGVSTAINVPGSDVFSNDSRGSTRLLGVSGAQVGGGASSGRGVARLQVTHLATTYSSGGVVPGSSSAGRDTVIGDHQLRLTVDPSGTSGTVSLNGGTTIGFTNPATDLAVTGPDGEVVYVDLSGATPGFDGTVDLHADGTLSLDGGRTATVIDFSSNQQVLSSEGNLILSVDSSNITQAGTDTVYFAGTLDIFSTLIAVRDGLRTAGDNGDVTGDLANVRDFLSELDAAHDQLLRYLGELGGTDSRLQAADARLDDFDGRLQELISNTEEVDIIEAISDLRENETTYQSALSVASRVNQLSLLNFI